MKLNKLQVNEKYIVSSDTRGKPLDGGKNYKLHLPTDIPASDFWSVLVFDCQTRLMICSNQPWPSVHKQKKNLIFNADGSVDVYFAPSPLAGMEGNWVQTIPGKCWYMALNLYEPLEPWNNKTWLPGDIEIQN